VDTAKRIDLARGRKEVLNYIMGLGNCKENGSRILKMLTGRNYILGLVYCKGLKGIFEVGFCKELRMYLE